MLSVKKGSYGVGYTPFGYRRDGTTLIVDDHEAEVVRTIFRQYLLTQSTGRVIEYLQSKNILTRKNNKWSRQAISIIISNRTYRGRVRQGDLEVAGRHEAIISEALFYKVQKIKRRNKRAPRPHKVI